MMKMMSVEIPKRYKAKIALINEDGDVWTMRRSLDDENRPGGDDWPGGNVKDEGNEHETIRAGLFRELGEEMPGTKLIPETVTEIYTKPKVKDGVIIISHLFAGVAMFPEGGAVFSHEHDHGEYKPREAYPSLDMPSKYETGLIVGEQVIDHLVELQQTGKLEPRALLLGQAA